ncbi:MAG: tryptophan-rich sensory protein [Nanoarchaeota archaeon]|nr:tryptophan-rich sensory protein [Nanoarchaeota archaeon]
MEKSKTNWKVLILCLIIVYLVALIGSIFTSPNTSTDWYNSVRPSITPPNWVFPIVWNILFFLIACSLYLAWINSKNKDKPKLIWVFGINFFLNILWSVLYFGLKNPLLSFFELILLEASIVGMILITKKISKKASYFLWPYLIWVAFAGILNFLSAF